MKILLLISLLLVSSSAGAVVRVEKPALLESASPFTPDGVVSDSEMKLHTRVEINKIEEGQLNGVNYRFYYTDGSGTFSGAADGALTTGFDRNRDWKTACRKDAMDDKKSCYLQRGDLWIWLYGDGRLQVSIGGDQYPGTSASIRVDSNTAITSPANNEGFFTTAHARRIVEQLHSGSRVATRYVDWPYRSAVDSTFDLQGFDEAYQYIQWALKQIR